MTSRKKIFPLFFIVVVVLYNIFLRVLYLLVWQRDGRRWIDDRAYHFAIKRKSVHTWEVRSEKWEASELKFKYLFSSFSYSCKETNEKEKEKMIDRICLSFRNLIFFNFFTPFHIILNRLHSREISCVKILYLNICRNFRESNFIIELNSFEFTKFNQKKKFLIANCFRLN